MKAHFLCFITGSGEEFLQQRPRAGLLCWLGGLASLASYRLLVFFSARDWQQITATHRPRHVQQKIEQGKLFAVKCGVFQHTLARMCECSSVHLCGSLQACHLHCASREREIETYAYDRLKAPGDLDLVSPAWLRHFVGRSEL